MMNGSSRHIIVTYAFSIRASTTMSMFALSLDDVLLIEYGTIYKANSPFGGRFQGDIDNYDYT